MDKRLNEDSQKKNPFFVLFKIKFIASCFSSYFIRHRLKLPSYILSSLMILKINGKALITRCRYNLIYSSSEIFE